MTVVCYRDGIMASDSLITADLTRHGSIEKISINKAGWIGGTAGLIVTCEVFHAWLKAGASGVFTGTTAGDDFAAILISPSGVMYHVDDTGRRCKVKSDFMSIGSGCDFALGAMQHGANAIRAVEAAIALSTNCGGEIQIIKAKKRRNS